MNINSPLINIFLDIIVGLSALIGSGLGFYNFCHARSKEKVRLVVIPKSVVSERKDFSTGERGYILSDQEHSILHPYFAIEIINKSNFNVFVDEVGFSPKGFPHLFKILKPILNKKDEWPKELKPRESVTIYLYLNQLIEKIKSSNIKNAYAKTSCNNICYGNSKALKNLIEDIKKNNEFSTQTNLPGSQP